MTLVEVLERLLDLAKQCHPNIEVYVARDDREHGYIVETIRGIDLETVNGEATSVEILT